MGPVETDYRQPLRAEGAEGLSTPMIKLTFSHLELRHLHPTVVLAEDRNHTIRTAFLVSFDRFKDGLQRLLPSGNRSD